MTHYVKENKGSLKFPLENSDYVPIFLFLANIKPQTRQHHKLFVKHYLPKNLI